MSKTATYALIASQTVTGSAVTSIQFSSIPNTYTDLVLVTSIKQVGSPTATDAFITLNGNGASVYSRTILYGDGVNATSSRASNMDRLYFFLSPSSEFVTTTINFMDYSNTTTAKSILWRFGTGGSGVGAGCYLYNSLLAIDTIAVTASDRMGSGSPDSLDVGSTFRLYGIQAGNA